MLCYVDITTSQSNSRLLLGQVSHHPDADASHPPLGYIDCVIAMASVIQMTQDFENESIFYQSPNLCTHIIKNAEKCVKNA
jgi:hypothetical protein